MEIHFTEQNIKIGLDLSSLYNIQSRFITKFDNIKYLVDTPETTFQGFAVNTKCEGFEQIFKQVINNFINSKCRII